MVLRSNKYMGLIFCKRANVYCNYRFKSCDKCKLKNFTNIQIEHFILK